MSNLFNFYSNKQITQLLEAAKSKTNDSRKADRPCSSSSSGATSFSFSKFKKQNQTQLQDAEHLQIHTDPGETEQLLVSCTGPEIEFEELESVQTADPDQLQIEQTEPQFTDLDESSRSSFTTFQRYPSLDFGYSEEPENDGVPIIWENLPGHEDPTVIVTQNEPNSENEMAEEGETILSQEHQLTTAAAEDQLSELSPYSMLGKL